MSVRMSVRYDTVVDFHHCQDNNKDNCPDEKEDKHNE